MGRNELHYRLALERIAALRLDVRLPKEDRAWAMALKAREIARNELKDGRETPG